MLRFMAERRSAADVCQECLDYSIINDLGHFVIPEASEITSFQVVVSTMASSAKFVNLGIKPGHYSVFVFDEAGYTSEPELVQTFASLLDNEKSPQIIIAGDPKQLGPRIRSGLAQAYGTHHHHHHH